MEYTYIKIPKADPREYSVQELQDILRKMMTDYSKYDNDNHPADLPTFDQKLPQIMFYMIYEQYLNQLTNTELSEIWSIIEDGNNFRSKASKFPELIRAMCPTYSAPIFNSKPIQRIYYGAPGTGKSHEAKLVSIGYQVYRTTFHPDTDYSQFVGSYKPVVTESATGNRISYKYVPQTFTIAYCEAWKRFIKSIVSNAQCTPICIIIEELNRGNCAQIFGDLFQLLDRGAEGLSEYSIIPDIDLCSFIKGYFSDIELEHYYKIIQSNCDLEDDGQSTIPDRDFNNPEENIIRLCLPPNLSIVCTMNTSDQSLFPMDSAFKRRWAWEYVPINADCPDSQFKITIGDKTYKWASFLKLVNERIHNLSDSEDKQMGNFFIKSDVDVEEFKSKVMFYLWSEVCKEYEKSGSFFKDKNDNEAEFTFNSLFPTNDVTNKRLQGFMDYLGVEEA